MSGLESLFNGKIARWLASVANQPLGVVQPDEDGDVTGFTFLSRVGTAAVIDNVILKADSPSGTAEIAYVTDLREYRYGDDTTPGGLFLAGGAIWYGTPSNTAVTLTSSSVASQVDTHSCKAGSVTTIQGCVEYTDADSASNFKLVIDNTGTHAYGGLEDPTQFGGVADATFSWIANKWWCGANDSAVTHQIQTNTTTGQAATWTDPTTNRSAGKLYFSFTFATRVAGTVTISFFRRQDAGAGTVTCKYAYSIQRVE